MEAGLISPSPAPLLHQETKPRLNNLYTNKRKGKKICLLSCVCFPYTFCRRTVGYLYNFLFRLPFLSSDFFLTAASCFYDINFHNMMIRSPFRRKHRVWPWNKLVGWIWRCQYVIYSSPILTSPLHICIYIQVMALWAEIYIVLIAWS